MKSLRWGANEIIALRAQLGLSQSELARRFGVAQTTVSRWESGAQRPDPAVGMKLSQLLHEVRLSTRLQPEIALVQYSPFPMAIISMDWMVLAMSQHLLDRSQPPRRTQEFRPKRKNTTADMEQAVSILEERGFSEGGVIAARIVARGMLLGDTPQLFDALCTPVVIDGVICRMMQYALLSEAEFLRRRGQLGLVTFLGKGQDGEAGPAPPPLS